ncbi:ATP-binding protein [Roseivirga pacifica]|uniref:hybrid sensor histidine kinase/response regulator n=1 Tax=Roseivirga pacifica TaxID=1267423 RepID=UPI003BAF15EF
MRLFITTVLSLLSSVSYADSPGVDVHFQNNVRLYSEGEYEISDRQILVYRDDMNAMEFEDVLNLAPNEFISLKDISYFDNTKTHWAFFQITNPTEEPHRYILKGGRNAKETYFIESDDGLEVKKTGYFFAANERDILDNYHTQVSINLAPETTKKVYVKIESPDNLPLNISFKLTPESQWTAEVRRKNLFEGVFSGVLIAIFIVSMFFYVTRTSNVFLYISLYALCHLLYFGQIHGFFEVYLLPNTSNVLPPIWQVPLLSIAFYYFFAREFVESKVYHPKWDVGLKWLSYSGIGLFVLINIYLLFTNDYWIVGNIMYGFILLSGIVSVAFLFVVNQDGNPISKYFIYGTTFLVFIAILSAINELLYFTNSAPIIVQTGILIETVIFSLGLAHKIKRDVEDHYITQRSLIIQLQQTEKLHENINQELEEQVAERTQLIKEQNIELEEAKQVAEKATQAKSDFLSVMSHEIRTPLNAIISLSHIMEMDNKDNEMVEYIDALKFSAESLHSLINDILDFNKIEAGKLRLEQVEFSLIDLLKNISETFKYKAHSKGIKLLIEVGEHTPDRLMGDPTRLTQIFNNLLSNAIKFTHEGHVLLKVFLKGIKDNTANIHFEVVDTGIGIPKDKLETIFMEFEQADMSTTREYGGTGLGLSITKKLLHMMGSKIQVKSTEDQGSNFSFNIPFEINKTFTLVSYTDPENNKNLDQAKFLVVDDNDMNRLVLRRLMNNWNVDFVEASNGNDAIRLCNEIKFDLVLMDIEMKPINGFETLTLIKSESKLNAATPFIAMSAYQPDDFDVKINETEFAAIVNKPFDPEDLFERIIKNLNQ